MKTCPYCAEMIQDKAIVCRYCGRDLVETNQPTRLPVSALPSPGQPPPKRWSLQWVVFGVLMLACLVSGGLIASQSISLSHAEATEQAFQERVSEVSHLIDQQVTATAISHSISATATAATRTRYISDPFQAVLTLDLDPKDGSLAHPGGKFSRHWCPTVWLRDFVAEASFQNPYDAAFNPWDFGFLFRRTENDDEYRLVVSSKQRWHLILWEDGEALGNMAEGELSNLRTGENEFNTMKYVARGDAGYLYINDSLISSMSLDRRLLDGEVCVVTGTYNGYKIEGYETVYEDFTIWSMDATP